MRVPVFMQFWEIECCQPPPGVGDDVEWRLLWAPASAGVGVIELNWETASGVEADDTDGLLIGSGPLTAWWYVNDGDQTSDVPLRGSLIVDSHGPSPDGWESVRGQVVAVDVVDQVYRRAGDREYVLVPDEFSTRRVRRAPRRFEHGWIPSRDNRGEEPSVNRAESGVLIQLEVDSSGPR